MQRLEIVWRLNVLFGTPAPLTDDAGYWEINVKVCDGEHYVDAVGYDNEGQAVSEHVAPLELVRSVSAREIPDAGAERVRQELATKEID